MWFFISFFKNNILFTIKVTFGWKPTYYGVDKWGKKSLGYKQSVSNSSGAVSYFRENNSLRALLLCRPFTHPTKLWNTEGKGNRKHVMSSLYFFHNIQHFHSAPSHFAAWKKLKSMNWCGSISVRILVELKFVFWVFFFFLRKNHLEVRLRYSMRKLNENESVVSESCPVR